MSEPKRPQYTRRKTPRQQRSRITVESLLQAAAEIIEQRGFAAVTTTSIAEHAGISVGSLYEYFPNREAILLSLYESASVQAAAAVRDGLEAMLDLPVEEAVPQLIETLFSVYAGNSKVLLELLDEVPELKRSLRPISYDSLVRSAVRVYLLQLGVRREGDAMQQCLFFTNHLVIGSIRQYLITRPNYMRDEEFLEELSSLAVGYVRSLVQV